MKTDLKKPGIGSIGDRPWVFVDKTSLYGNI